MGPSLSQDAPTSRRAPYESSQPIRATRKPNASEANKLPLIQRGNNGAQHTGSDDAGPCQVQHAPLINQRVHRLFLRNAHFGTLILQRRSFECAHLGLQLRVGRADEEECKGHDAGKEEGGCDVEAEGEGVRVLCP